MWEGGTYSPVDVDVRVKVDTGAKVVLHFTDDRRPHASEERIVVAVLGEVDTMPVLRVGYAKYQVYHWWG